MTGILAHSAAGRESAGRSHVGCYPEESSALARMCPVVLAVVRRQALGERLLLEPFAQTW